MQPDLVKRDSIAQQSNQPLGFFDSRNIQRHDKAVGGPRGSNSGLRNRCRAHHYCFPHTPPGAFAGILPRVKWLSQHPVSSSSMLSEKRRWRRERSEFARILESEFPTKWDQVLSPPT